MEVGNINKPPKKGQKIIGHRFVWFRKGKMSGYETGSKLRQQVKVPPNISKTNSKEIITTIC